MDEVLLRRKTKLAGKHDSSFLAAGETLGVFSGDLRVREFLADIVLP
jgi:hypothetical protein